jgi:hypothetical protein
MHERVKIGLKKVEEMLPRDSARPRTMAHTPVNQLHVGQITWLQRAYRVSEHRQMSNDRQMLTFPQA